MPKPKSRVHSSSSPACNGSPNYPSGHWASASSIPAQRSAPASMSGRRGPAATGGGRGGGGGGGGNWRRSGSAKAKEQRLRLGAEELLESRLGFAPYTDGERRLGWLLTFSPVSSISPSLVSSLQLFWVESQLWISRELGADLHDAVIRVGLNCHTLEMRSKVK